MPIYALDDLAPTIDPDAFVHPDATLIGDVHIGPGANVWSQAVLRGDYGRIEIREGSSVQDGTVIHAGPRIPTTIGPHAMVGHLAHLEGCTIEPWALVGSMAVVLHRCVINSHAIVGANALVPNDTIIPPNALALGVPCTIHPERVESFVNKRGLDLYVSNGKRYRQAMRRID